MHIKGNGRSKSAMKAWLNIGSNKHLYTWARSAGNRKYMFARIVTVAYYNMGAEASCVGRVENTRSHFIRKHQCSLYSNETLDEIWKMALWALRNSHVICLTVTHYINSAEWQRSCFFFVKTFFISPNHMQRSVCHGVLLVSVFNMSVRILPVVVILWTTLSQRSPISNESNFITSWNPIV